MAGRGMLGGNGDMKKAAQAMTDKSHQSRHGPSVKRVVTRGRPAGSPEGKINSTMKGAKLHGPGVCGC